MKASIQLTVASALLLFAVGPLAAQEAARPAPGQPPNQAANALQDDSGTFVYSLNGKEYGRENFHIRFAKESIQADADVQLREDASGHPVAFNTSPKLLLDSQFNPKVYDWSLKGSKDYKLHVDFTGDLVKSDLHLPDGKDDVREFKLPKDVVVLDNNVTCLYELLAMRYATSEGGKQSYQAYLPQDATPGVLTIQDAGTENIDVGGGKQDLKHLVILTDNAQIDLWVDMQHRLQKLYVSASKLQALRVK